MNRLAQDVVAREFKHDFTLFGSNPLYFATSFVSKSTRGRDEEVKELQNALTSYGRTWVTRPSISPRSKPVDFIVKPVSKEFISVSLTFPEGVHSSELEQFVEQLGVNRFARQRQKEQRFFEPQGLDEPLPTKQAASSPPPKPVKPHGFVERFFGFWVESVRRRRLSV